MIPKSQSVLNRNIVDGEWNGERIRYRRDRLIVKLKASDHAESLERAVSEITAAIPGSRLIRRPSSSGRLLLAVDPSADVTELAASLMERDDVEYAEPDVVDHATIVPSDPRFVDQWGLTTIGMPAAWDLQTGTTMVVIGIIDSGISMAATGGLDHPDLNDATRYVLGTDFVDGGDPRDLNGHGTHVAGIAAAQSNNANGVSGMNWGSHVYICRTLDANGNGSGADFADAVEEIVDFAVAHGVKAVINYSGGGGASMAKQDACQYAHDHGMILCAATGNDNGGPVIWPAAYSAMFAGVIAVGSVDDNDTVSSFSNIGPEVTVVAPGRDILSTMPTYAVGIPAALNYDELSGTSMATPMVTGLVALMWSRHPGFTNVRIRNCLTGSARKLGPGTFDNTWGNGRVDAVAALRCGDSVFPTRFTDFTLFTNFTFPTITRFTRFTFFTPFTLFTRFTPFTPFTRFTVEPPPFEIDPLIRIGTKVFGLSEIELRRIEKFESVADPLSAIGITHLNQLVSANSAQVADALGSDVNSVKALQSEAEQTLTALANP